MAARQKAPSVSVVLTTHNRPRYLPESIESILHQSFADFELLIIDDGSSDPEPRRIAQKYAEQDRRIRTITLSENLGLASARNRGIDEAGGTWIMFHDDDDVSVPTRLEKQVGFLRKHAEYALVGGRKAVCDEQLTVQYAGPPESFYTQPVMPPLDSITRLMSANVDPAALVRRDCLLEMGGYRPWFKLVEDWDLTLRLQEKYSMAALPEIVLHYRMHDLNQLTDSAQLWHYTVAAFVCGQRRRTGADEPIGEGVDARSTLPLLGELPAPTQQVLLDIRYRDLRDLLSQGELRQALAVLDEILLAQGVHTARNPSIREALRICRACITDRKGQRRLSSIQRRMLWLCLRHMELGYWFARSSQVLSTGQ